MCLTPGPRPPSLSAGLFPAVLNLASMAEISANATCGSLGPEMFCKLVEHVPGQPVRNPQCRICNQRSVKPFGRKIPTTQQPCRPVVTIITAAALVNWCWMTVIFLISPEEITNQPQSDAGRASVRRKTSRIFGCRCLPAF